MFDGMNNVVGMGGSGFECCGTGGAFGFLTGVICFILLMNAVSYVLWRWWSMNLIHWSAA